MDSVSNTRSMFRLKQSSKYRPITRWNLSILP